MVEYYSQRIKKTFSKFDRFSQFVLIGNNIDGFVNVDIIRFGDYEEVKRTLPLVFESLKYEGEWDIHLYQIPKNWSIHHKYGYYRVPNKGRVVFQFSYMHSNMKNQIFLTNSIIHIFTFDQYFNHYSKKTFGEKNLPPLNITEISLTIELLEPIDGRKISYSEFNGTVEEL